MIRNVTIEDAEAKLLASLSHLVWIIPGIAFINLILCYTSNSLASFSFDSYTTVIIALLAFIIVFKMIIIIDKQLNAERERKVENEKLTYQQKSKF